MAVIMLTASCVQESRPAEVKPPLAGPPAAGTAVLLMPAVVSAAKTAAQSLKFEKAGDAEFARLKKIHDSKRAMDIAGNSIDDYKKGLDLDENNDRLMHKYCMAIKMKYYYMLPVGENEAERREVFSQTLERLKRLHPGDDNTIYADYDLAILLILNAQYFSLFQIFGVVNRIHELCGRVYARDRAFEDYSAVAALGRINLLAPNIPFLMGWPDRELSRQYLEEAAGSKPDSLLMRFYLGDTMYSLGKKDDGISLFKSVINTPAREGIECFEDNKAKLETLKRMKELGLYP